MIKLTTVIIDDSDCKAVENVLRKGFLVHGDECISFENELNNYLGSKNVLVVSSCTAALHLALIALGIGKGDAVIVPDFTFPATVNAVELTGATPLLIDVDETTYNINTKLIPDAIKNWKRKEKIKAIIPVHEFGCPADMDKINDIAEKNNLFVIEDAACALGTKYKNKMAGTIGNIGCFSFHPRKALTTGEGGAIAVNDIELANKIKALRNHGIEQVKGKPDFILPGFNYRLTNFQAALGKNQLTKFDSWLKKRNKLQMIYREKLQNLPLQLPANIHGHSWQTFMVVLSEKFNRNSIIKQLKDSGVETNLGAYAIHSLKFYNEKYSFCNKYFPIATKLYKQGLALPFSQNMTEEDINYVVKILGKAFLEK